MKTQFLFGLAVAGMTMACVVLATASADAGLIVHYTFDGDTGTTAVDQAGGDTPLTLGSGSSFTTDGYRGDVLQTSATQGASLSFTSTTQNYTFTGWYKGTGVGYWYDQTDRFITSVEANTNQDPGDGGAASGLGVYDNSWHNSTATSANDGVWHQLIWVFETDGLGAGNDSYSIYLDGVAQDVDPGTGGIQTKRQLANGIKDLDSAKQFLFANLNGNASELSGLVDDVRIYDHALSASEVAALTPQRFDVNDDAGSPTQAGWTAADAGNINNVTFSAVGAGIVVDDRDRGALNTDDPGGDTANNDMWRDFIFANGSNAVGEGLDITVSGLDGHSLYDVVLWAYDENSGNARTADWTGSGLFGTSATLSFDGNNPDPQSLSDYVTRFQAQTDGFGTLVLQGRYGGGGDAHNVFVNGFELTLLSVVPEPTTLLIWSLLAGLGVGLGWRRRK